MLRPVKVPSRFVSNQSMYHLYILTLFFAEY
jgi:hypothetical protein